MSTNTSLTTSLNGVRSEGGNEPGTSLDQSRSKASSAQQALADAHRHIDDLDARIGRNAAKTSADETALRSALDEVKRLKKTLKDGEKERQKLVLSRKRAVADIDKAQEKARKAEAKYDRALLADLIEREKEHDREGASSPRASAPVVDGQAGPAPATEPEDLATATARTTAARTTAASAGEGAQPAPTPPTPRRTTTRMRTSRSRSFTEPSAFPSPPVPEPTASPDPSPASADTPPASAEPSSPSAPGTAESSPEPSSS